MFNFLDYLGQDKETNGRNSNKAMFCIFISFFFVLTVIVFYPKIIIADNKSTQIIFKECSHHNCI